MRSNQVGKPGPKRWIRSGIPWIYIYIYTNKILCEVTFRMTTHYSLRIWPDIIFLQRKWRLFQMAKRRSALHRMMFISRQPKSSGPDVHSTTNPKMMRFKKNWFMLFESRVRSKSLIIPFLVECWLLVQFPFSGFLHGLPTRVKDACPQVKGAIFDVDGTLLVVLRWVSMMNSGEVGLRIKAKGC